MNEFSINQIPIHGSNTQNISLIPSSSGSLNTLANSPLNSSLTLNSSTGSSGNTLSFSLASSTHSAKPVSLMNLSNLSSNISNHFSSNLLSHSAISQPFKFDQTIHPIQPIQLSQPTKPLQPIPNNFGSSQSGPIRFVSTLAPSNTGINLLGSHVNSNFGVDSVSTGPSMITPAKTEPAFFSKSLLTEPIQLIQPVQQFGSTSQGLSSQGSTNQGSPNLSGSTSHVFPLHNNFQLSNSLISLGMDDRKMSSGNSQGVLGSQIERSVLPISLIQSSTQVNSSNCVNLSNLTNQSKLEPTKSGKILESLPTSDQQGKLSKDQGKVNLIRADMEDLDPYDTELWVDSEDNEYDLPLIPSGSSSNSSDEDEELIRFDLEAVSITGPLSSMNLSHPSLSEENTDKDREEEKEDKEEKEGEEDQSDCSSLEEDYSEDEEDDVDDYEKIKMTREELIEECHDENLREYDIVIERLRDTLKEYVELLTEKYYKSVQTRSVFDTDPAPIPVHPILTLSTTELLKEIDDLANFPASSVNLQKANELQDQMDHQIDLYEELKTTPYPQLLALGRLLVMKYAYPNLVETPEWIEQIKLLPNAVLLVPKGVLQKVDEESDEESDEERDDVNETEDNCLELRVDPECAFNWNNSKSHPIILDSSELNQVTLVINRLQELLNQYEDKMLFSQVEQRRNATALSQIRIEQKRTDLIIPKDRFDLLAREILQDYSQDLTFDKEALEALQTAAEDFLINTFEESMKSNVSSTRSKRKLLEENNLEMDDQANTLEMDDIRNGFEVTRKRYHI